jgi:hypothetical protein
MIGLSHQMLVPSTKIEILPLKKTAALNFQDTLIQGLKNTNQKTGMLPVYKEADLF